MNHADQIVERMRQEWPKLEGSKLERVREIVNEVLSAPEEPQVKRPTKRNVLLDALVEACGGDPKQTPKMAFRAAGVALADIQSVCASLTVEEIYDRAARYKRLHPDWPLTPMSLCKHWASLGGGPRTIAARQDIYVEPPGWRIALQEIYKLSPENVNEKQWLDLGPDTRRNILMRMKT